MVDASNILRFEGVGGTADDVKYVMELWVFKPQKTGQQVIVFLREKLIIPLLYHFYLSFLHFFFSVGQKMSSIH